MKRVIVWGLTLALAGLSGCGGSSSDKSGTDASVEQDQVGGQDSSGDVAGREDTVLDKDTALLDQRGEDLEPGDVTQPEDNATPDDTTGTDAKDTGGGLTAPSLQTTYVYRLYRGGSSEYIEVPGVLAGEVEYDGGTWVKGIVGDFGSGAPEGLAVYVQPHVDAEMGVGLAFKALEVYTGKATPDFWYKFDQPAYAYSDLEVGEKQTVEASGVLGMSYGEELPMEATIEYTLVTKEGTVEVPFGTVEGCFHYAVDVWEVISGEGSETPMSADVFVKPGVGIIRISMVPGFDAMELVSYDEPL